MTDPIYLILIVVLAICVWLITLSRVKSRQIAETNRHLGAITSTSLDAIILVDKDGLVREFNHVAEQMFGWSRAEILNQRLVDFVVPPVHRAAYWAEIAQLIGNDKLEPTGTGRKKTEGLHKDGRLVPVELTLNTVILQSGKVIVAILRNLTSELEAEKALIEARDRAIAGEAVKSNMLTIMSHEIRTPLNGIMGSLELLAHTPLNDEQREYLGIMQKSGNTLIAHANDVLDITRLDRDLLTFEMVEFSPVRLIEDLIAEYQDLAESSGNQLLRRIELMLDAQFVGDPNRLRQVLGNLVENAIRFTKNGRVEFFLTYDENRGHLEFSVKDSGIGIIESEQERIFEDFVTLDNSYARRHEGAGLGLGIARRISEAMGGEIILKSQAGQGSVFLLRLPAKKLQNPVTDGFDKIASEETQRAGNRLKILLIEDNDTNRFIMQQFLSKLGHDSVEAINGVEGVLKATSEKFDLIFMDISMPEMDGVEATIKIREADNPNQSTPIIAITTHALPEELSYFEEVGMQQALIKPITPKCLVETLDALLPVMA